MNFFRYKKAHKAYAVPVYIVCVCVFRVGRFADAIGPCYAASASLYLIYIIQFTVFPNQTDLLNGIVALEIILKPRV